jgi:hypothetical protein
MSSGEKNKAVLRRVFEASREGRSEYVDEACADDFTDRSQGTATTRHVTAQCFVRIAGDKGTFMRWVGYPEVGGWLHIH